MLRSSSFVSGYGAVASACLASGGCGCSGASWAGEYSAECLLGESGVSYVCGYAGDVPESGGSTKSSEGVGASSSVLDYSVK